MRPCPIVCTASLNVEVIAYSFCWRERKQKYDFIQKLPVPIVNKPRSPRSKTITLHLAPS
jgi:hypothetical protein